MFNLDLPADPYWLDLPHGVRVKVRPLQSAIIAAATAHADRVVLDIIRDRADRLAANEPLDVSATSPDTDDPNVRRGVYETELAVGLARYGIIDWDGIGADAEHAAPFSRDGAEKLARSALGPTFLARYQVPIQAVVAEGNGSATAASGISAAVATIAGDAANAAASAQAA